MAVKHTIFAQKNVKNNLNLAPNSMQVLPKKAVQGLRLAIRLTTGNQGGYWTGNLLYCPAGWNVAHFMLAVQRSQADRPVLDAGSDSRTRLPPRGCTYGYSNPDRRR
jgi:uncharacterized protein YcsI (UPF0317 family)